MNKYRLKDVLNKLRFLIWRANNVHLFKKFGESSIINQPLRISNPQFISIGNNVRIGYKVWLASVPTNKSCIPNLEINDGTYIGNFNHIYSINEIIIGKSVLIADRVYISDNLHSYEDISIPIINQPLKQLNSVNIGDGSWIGENVCIIGASIGKNCVVGANSVVTKDIPDYSVAVGSPARVIKRYNKESKKWERV